MSEQPDQNLMTIEEIKGLISQVNNKISSLDILGSTAEITRQRKTLVGQALEEIDIFQRITLHDMAEGKAFE